ncbi:hypothetical protein CAEBREN_25955 [Caenorhabditis brenneri]|uniref:SPK domain-containing protein n=1 Tax=Caenorhabditis brenneri TaxID=135651 RepID=G0NBY0_CAEBE|nr:hypothetical protein CAEBREN_25955 [Caenorhabditis brenneri]
MPSTGLLDQDRLVKFLVDITQNATRPLTMIHVMSDYKAIQGHTVTASTLRRQFRQEIAPRMHEMQEYDDETKVKLIFATSTTVDPRFLAKLRLRATVEVDEKQRITKYASDTIQLEGKHQTLSTAPSDFVEVYQRVSPPPTFKLKSIKREVKEQDSMDPVDRKSMKMDLASPTSSSSQSLPTPLDSFLEMMAQNSQNSMDLPPQDPALQNPMDLALQSLFGTPQTPPLPPSPTVSQSPPALPESPGLPSIQEDPIGGDATEGQFVSAIGNFLNSMNGMFGVMTETMNNRNDTPAAAAPQSSSSSITAAAAGPSCPNDAHTTTTTKKQFLTHIQMCLLSIDNRQLTEFYHRVVGALEKCKNEPVVMSKLRLALQNIVTISMANGFGSRREEQGASPQTTNAKKFLQLLELFVSAQEAPELEKLHEQLKATIASTDDAKEIEVKMVQMAFETALITMGIY